MKKMIPALALILSLSSVIGASNAKAETFNNVNGVSFEQSAGFTDWTAPASCRNHMTVEVTIDRPATLLRAARYSLRASMSFDSDCNPVQWYTANDVIKYSFY